MLSCLFALLLFVCFCTPKAIQRQLEEVAEKQRDVEERGVTIEKTIRGEIEGGTESSSHTLYTPQAGCQTFLNANIVVVFYPWHLLHYFLNFFYSLLLMFRTSIATTITVITELNDSIHWISFFFFLGNQIHLNSLLIRSFFCITQRQCIHKCKHVSWSKCKYISSAICYIEEITPPLTQFRLSQMRCWKQPFIHFFHFAFKCLNDRISWQPCRCCHSTPAAFDNLRLLLSTGLATATL